MVDVDYGCGRPRLIAEIGDLFCWTIRNSLADEMTISETLAGATSPEVLDPEDWVDAYGDDFFRYARSRLRDAAAAEEVVQEAFMAGIRHLNSFAGSGSQRAWLMTILRRKVIDYVRSRNRILEQSWAGETDPTALLFDENGRWKPGALPKVEPGARLESSELWDVVKGCLEGLPTGQADVFVLSVIDEMETEEICKELDITPSNLWVRLHRARLGLAKCVGTKWFSQSGVTGS
ncbi:MAG: sigma-70 family RNA polymerase sigma factor [Aureliella sp.]